VSVSSRRKGARWEQRVAAALTEDGVAVTRAAPGSHADHGDLLAGGWVVECKDAVRLDLAGWVAQAAAAAEQAGCPGRWVVVAHRKGRVSPRDAYLLIPWSALVAMLGGATDG